LALPKLSSLAADVIHSGAAGDVVAAKLLPATSISRGTLTVAAALSNLISVTGIVV